MNKLPEKLNILRKHYGYSQSYLAERLGIDVVTYMGFENGRTIPTFDILKQIANVYGITVDSLFINDLNIELNSASSHNVDRANYSYLRNQTKKKQVKEHLAKKWPIYGLGILGVLCLFAFFILHEPNIDLTLKQEMTNKRLISASDTSVIYLDRQDSAQGRGDNSNGQIDLNDDNVFKVDMGATFSVILYKDGTLNSHGLLSKYANEINKWKDIVDIAVGKGHIMALNTDGAVLCTGNDNLGQCRFDGENHVQKIFADDNASFIVRDDGTVETAGSFLGKSKMKNIPSLIDVAISEDISAYLTEDNHVVVYTNTNSFNECNRWNDIIDIAVGDEFIAGLDKDGYVHIDIDNYKIKDEVASWKNILAIAAGSDYLVAYDGQTIKGIGNNAYHQFEVSESQKIVLPAVTNIKIEIDDYNVKIKFDSVANATEYRLELDAGIGYAMTSSNNQFVIPIDKFEDGHEYIIKIVSLGDERYEVSPPTVISYRFSKPEENREPEVTPTEPEPSMPTEVEIPFTLDLLTGKTRASFEAYLRGFGVKEENLNAIPSANICTGSEEIIESVEGISDYETLTKSDLLNRKITYQYCQLEVNHE